MDTHWVEGLDKKKYISIYSDGRGELKRDKEKRWERNTTRCKGSARNNLDNSDRKCAADSVDFLSSKPQRSLLREDFEDRKSGEDVVQLRIGKSKLFLTEP